MPPKKQTERKLAMKVNQLEQKLASLSTGTQPKPKRKRKPKKAVAGVGRSINMNAGEVTISKLELCGTVKIDAKATASNGTCSLYPPDLPFLNTLAKSFERIKWLSCTVMYKSASSMTQAGLFSMGVDWNWTGPETTRKKIAGYSPTTTTAVWKETTMVLPPSRLQSRLWYSTSEAASADAGPGQIAWAADSAGGTSGVTLGEVWVQYRVTLSGTRA